MVPTRYQYAPVRDAETEVYSSAVVAVKPRGKSLYTSYSFQDGSFLYYSIRTKYTGSEF